ncbi:hypothetical protein AK812_SmicGene40218 [Symbiodinium microadriaticum]|uniref:Uncharacterized protein n=1 Tax=Symbiodinium microadriaticum TaxID=2951 RepID=A0A1Q9C9E3_SYMMI|nr:hypothetical protein AK812_SmicGene40218 [Symbiodinium microadriaticum]CAE7220300.1 unnamed protein product [Symbiodinium microadriaticum]CAE7307230.1 unnamed protein product [Symbiodinium sp. KB8]
MSRGPGCRPAQLLWCCAVLHLCSYFQAAFVAPSGTPRHREIRQSLRAAASQGGLPELLASRAPGVIVFGADYCGPCKVLLGRLKRLGLLGPPKGATYADAEDLAPGGGAELLNAVLAGAPFSPPLPVMAVLGPGELQRLEAGQELLTLTDDELTALCTID